MTITNTYNRLANQLEHHWPLQIHIPGSQPKQLLAHHSVTIKELKQQIIDRDLLPVRTTDKSNTEEYFLYAGKEPLLPNFKVAQLRQQNIRQLDFRTSNKNFASLSMKHFIVLEPREEGVESQIVRTLPTIIGRRKTSVQSDEWPDIDFSYLPNSQTISGKHARISRRDNAYYIENLTDRNRVVITTPQKERIQVQHDMIQLLEIGSEITLGKVKLRFVAKPTELDDGTTNASPF